MEEIISLLFCVGEDNYTLSEYIKEARDIGVSKRIPLTAIPQGLQKGLSKIFLAHPKAIVKVTAAGKTLRDLAYHLLTIGKIELQAWMDMTDILNAYWTGEELNPNDFVPKGMLDITYGLSECSTRERNELIKEYGLEFCMGVFGYVPFSGMEYVCGKDEDELPEHLQHLEGYIEPVQVAYTKDNTRCPSCGRLIIDQCDYCKEE